MASGTVSEMVLRARVPGSGEITARLFKHLAPVTLSLVRRAVPLIGRINRYDSSFAYILTNVVTGEEKSRREFKRGEIAFMPSGSMLCIFLQDTRSYKPMNLLGSISAGLEALEKSKRGDTLEIQSIDEVTRA